MTGQLTGYMSVGVTIKIASNGYEIMLCAHFLLRVKGKAKPQLWLLLYSSDDVVMMSELQHYCVAVKQWRSIGSGVKLGFQLI